MKYFFRVLFTLVLAVGIVFGVYYYTNGNPFEKQETVQLTTVSQQPATEKNADRQLLAQLKKEGYKLYKGTTGIILTHGKDEYEIENWGSLNDTKPPKMYLTDYDGDGTDEILVKAVSTENASTGEYTYEVFLLKPELKDSRVVKYNVYCANQSTWEDILANQIREEISQLKTCKKYLQVSMDSKSKAISYDSKTGIAKSGYNGYARALQNGNEYLTMQTWSKGKGVYSINKDKEICISVEVNISYKDSQTVQTAGHINFKLAFTSDRTFAVKEKTMNFKPESKYVVADPTVVTTEQWNYAENNSVKTPVGNDAVIDWIKYKPEFKSDVIEQTISLAEESTDIKNIQKVMITESYVELTAKSGFTFDSDVYGKGDFSIVITDGANNKYDIAYTASVMEVNGVQVLKITFDRAYARSDISSIEINYGAR
ncbi:MAG: hypothetical protein IJR60_03360 [Eubacterium sp.]|nr:hypothetical protein [Eubacterium sp.]